MARSLAFPLGLSVLLAGSAFSQSVVSVGGATGASGRVTARMTFGPGPFTLPATVGAPYSAEQSQERVQTLLDGTHITQSQGVTKQYRDSQGRTRTERPMMIGPIGARAAESPIIVEITDPVAGARYTLDTQNKVAHRVAVSAPPMPARQGATRTGAVSGGFGAVSGLLGGVLPPPAPPTSAQSLAISQSLPDAALRPQFATESLGTQVMEGVLVEGRRQTTTYPVNFQGNDRPIVVTSETWTSPDLKLTILNKSNDPRSGENTMKITNLSRAEPDPALFQPPADYTVVDETGPFTVEFSR